MKKILTVIFVLALLGSAKLFAQGWTYEGPFPDTTFQDGNTHAIAVDPDGKVWFGSYYSTDSIKTADGSYASVRDIYVYNADGTKADFSPIQTVTVNMVTDTLWNTNRGARADQNGNILWGSYTDVYRLNYKTGEGMDKLSIDVAGKGATAPAVDSYGNIFIRSVFPGFPVNMFKSDFSSLGNAIDSASGFSRTIEVSADGNTFYQIGYTNHCIIVYSRPDEFGTFSVADTILKGFDCESAGFNPATGYLWASAGSANDMPNRYPGATTSYSPQTWYAYDVSSKTIKDSIKWDISAKGSVDDRPRAIAFSPDGNTAYVGCFSGSGYSVEKFTRTGSDVKEEAKVGVKGYELSQNYPNPFNPSTKIAYNLKSPGYVTLKVYDMLGREVAKLVDQEMNSGSHSVTFDASNLASGTYVYRLSVNGVNLTQKMILLK